MNSVQWQWVSEWVSVVSTYPSLMVRMNCSNFLIDLLPRPTVFLITFAHINWTAAFTCTPRQSTSRQNYWRTDQTAESIFRGTMVPHLYEQKLQPSLGWNCLLDVGWNWLWQGTGAPDWIKITRLHARPPHHSRILINQLATWFWFHLISCHIPCIILSP